MASLASVDTQAPGMGETIFLERGDHEMLRVLNGAVTLLNRRLVHFQHLTTTLSPKALRFNSENEGKAVSRQRLGVEGARKWRCPVGLKDDRNRTGRLTVCLLIGWLIGNATGCGWSDKTEAEPHRQAKQIVSPVDRITVAARAIAIKDWETAETVLRKQLVEDPSDVRALEMAGDVAAARGERQKSATLYRAAIDQNPRASAELFDKCAQQLMIAGRPYESLEAVQQAIERYPSHPQFRFDVAGLATMIGMERLAIAPLKWLGQHNLGELDGLIVLADPARVEPDESVCNKSLERCPENLRPHYGLARIDAADLKWPEVADRLQAVVHRHSDFVPAQVLYGRALIELDRMEEVEQWARNLPPGVDGLPEYWLAAGLWAQKQGRHEEAARTFWEAVRRDDSNNGETLTKLLSSLGRIGRGDDTGPLAQRVRQIADLRDAMDTFFERKSESQSAALDIAKAMENLGRIWEAEGWARIALSLPQDPVAEARQTYAAIRAQLRADTPWQLPQSLIGQRLDLSGLPLVAWVHHNESPGEIQSVTAATIQLQDEAHQRGLIHTCEIAAAAIDEGHWIYQSVGGGTAVVDFNLDGWPDLALAMLNGQPLKSDSEPNRLFQNLAGRFRDVTQAAGFDDTGFAQGITVGDFNDDGFPDIFDANIGRNRMYQNNGDGTFRDVTVQLGLSGDFWTTSAVIADIDSDGNADLFEVNYCAGRQPYEMRCENKVRMGTCPPLNFDAEPDRVWRGSETGAFTEVTDRWLNQERPGRGLGLVVGRLDQRDGLDLYIANDMTVNHLWSAGRSDAGFQLIDLAVVRGVALSGRSTSQASMGMAAGDADGDGDIDLFLTHFADDHNTYYEQVSPGMWADRSYQVGLAESSMKLLGFGTEWVDFDNNGSVELIVANGHVDEVDRDGVTYRMPPQLYWRNPSGRWQELDRRLVGEYFAQDHLGRALATLDANRDGRTDVVITHLYDPVSLLINRTESGGRSLALVLKATEGHRDAIGAIVTFSVGNQSRTAQLTAGDGYMCANQRRISIGLGAAESAEDVVVRWPSGRRESFGTIKADSEYLLVEGSEEPFRLAEQ